MHPERKIAHLVRCFLAIYRSGLYLAVDYGLNGVLQLWQHGRIGNWDIMCPENYFHLRCESDEFLHGSYVGGKVGFRPVEPDWRRIVSITSKQQTIFAVNQ